MFICGHFEYLFRDSWNYLLSKISEELSSDVLEH